MWFMTTYFLSFILKALFTLRVVAAQMPNCCRMLAVFLVLSLTFSSVSCAPLSRPPKRRNTWYQPVATAAEKVLSSAAELLRLQKPPFTFHMDANGAKESLETLCGRISGQNLSHLVSKTQTQHCATYLSSKLLMRMRVRQLCSANCMANRDGKP